MNDLRARSVHVERVGNTIALSVALVGGTRVTFPISRIKSFTSARCKALGMEKLTSVRVEDRGATIAWPDLDIDFSVAEKLPAYLGIETAASVARRAGSVRSKAKAAAARANGTKGGRPRKPIAA